MAEKYKLQYWDHANTVLSIGWATNEEEYVAGDCVVRAIKETADVDQHNKKHFQHQNYTEPMTLSEARRYIAQNKEMLGSLIHDCVGLTLEDTLEEVEFRRPIRVRNISPGIHRVAIE